jgi:hypothetical protein
MWRKVMVFGALGGLMVSGSAAGRVHTIQKGETLGAIARRYGVTLPALTAANAIRNPNLIVEGRALSIPAPRPTPGPRATAPAARPAPGFGAASGAEARSVAGSRGTDAPGAAGLGPDCAEDRRATGPGGVAQRVPPVLEVGRRSE